MSQNSQEEVKFTEGTQQRPQAWSKTSHKETYWIPPAPQMWRRFEGSRDLSSLTEVQVLVLVIMQLQCTSKAIALCIKCSHTLASLHDCYPTEGYGAWSVGMAALLLKSWVGLVPEWATEHISSAWICLFKKSLFRRIESATYSLLHVHCKFPFKLISSHSLESPREKGRILSTFTYLLTYLLTHSLTHPLARSLTYGRIKIEYPLPPV